MSVVESNVDNHIVSKIIQKSFDSKKLSFLLLCNTVYDVTRESNIEKK